MIQKAGIIKQIAVGRQSEDGLNLLISGQRNPFSSGKYLVMLDRMGRMSLLEESGSFGEVLGHLRAHPKGPPCIALLREVGQAIGDRKSVLAGHFSGSELSAIALISGSPRSVQEVSECAGIKHASAYGAIMSLVSKDMISCDGNDRFSLTEAGAEMERLLCSERRYAKARARSSFPFQG